jgi:cation-transporting P-type ATPase E
MLPSTTRRSLHRTFREVFLIAFRHVVLPINAIIFGVVILLVVFGETREGLFLGAIVLLNILLGFGQDLRAWLLLERLQILTALKITLVGKDNSERQVTVEEISKGDRIKLKLGDQMPCDGTIISSTSIEVNEGLITGESTSFPRKDGETILAGSVITSGTGIVQAETAFEESRMAKMARGLKRYSANPSPIQRSIEAVIKYTVFVLLAVIAFIVARGMIQHEAVIQIVEQIGALASVLVPQGLVVATTLLFTFGAGHFYNRHVLLQEVNATEKFGRIKSLCMDKTGTLTENELTVERIYVPLSVLESEARELAALYIRYSGDSSQSIRALGTFLTLAPDRAMFDVLSFSSWRRYGGIAFPRRDNPKEGESVLVGGPEVFLPYIGNESEKSWLQKSSKEAAKAGKHVLCVVRARGEKVPHELSEEDLQVVCIFALGNRLRDGVRDAVDFFQSRGVTIRILSGDHPDTVQAISSAAGVRNTESIILGEEMKGWDAADYAKNAGKFAIFARIEPEQKERVIEALKADGFTAMVGDGANDALSVKRADLGIALYDGAAATRRIAAVVLMHNSFVELPAGVRLADSMIENIEIFAGLFLNQTFVQFWLFVALAFAGLDFPLSPLHVTFINYFTVGFTGILISAWAINPPERTNPASTRPFLARVIPLPLVLSVIQLIGVLGIFVAGRAYVPADSPQSLIIIGIIALGIVFFALSANVYSGGLNRMRSLGMLAFVLVESALVLLAFKVPLVLDFFGIAAPSFAGVQIVLLIAALCGIVQYAIVKLYFGRTTQPQESIER